MANCLLNTLRGIWSCFMGSLRMILFFGCLITLLLHLLGLIVFVGVSSNPDTVAELVASGQSHLSSRHLLALFFLTSLSLLGCYGSFYKHLPSIKLFGVVLGVCLILVFFAGIFLQDSDEDCEKQIERMFERLKDLMPKYKWTDKLRDWEDPDANRAWDSMQRFMCCGVKGARDWDKFRPTQYKYDDVYPPSCCLEPFRIQGNVCPVDKTFKDGCMERVAYFHVVAMVVSLLYIGFQLLLCLIACTVGNMTLQSCALGSSSDSVESNRQFLPRNQTHYQRQANYVTRQPPVNPHVVYSDAPSKLYPNFNDLDEKSSAPPPSYGTGR